MDNEILRCVLSEGLETGFSTVEVFGQETNRVECERFQGEPARVHTTETQRLTARAFWDTGDPVGFGLSKPGPAALRSALLKLRDSYLPDPKENFRSQLPSKVKKKSPAIFDETVDSVDMDGLNRLIDRIDGLVASPSFQGLELQRLQLSKTLSKIYIANTNNLAAKYRKTNFNLVLGFVLGDNRMDVSESRVFFQHIDPYKIISRAFNLLNSLTEKPVGMARNLFLVLSPEASAFILREFSHYFREKADREYVEMNYPAILNIIDDPFMDGQPGSAPFDDEGVQAAPPGKYLVRRGVFTGVISDLASAFQAGGVSTGNGFRSERQLFPGVRFSNLYIKPTILPLKNLMTHAGEGVLASLLKLKRIDNGGYVFSAYGYRFRGEDMLEPVHFYFKTSFRSYLLNIVKISREIKFFYSAYNIGSPYVLLEARRKADGLFEI
jgi:predicted Zn-dependent protease